MSTANTIQLDIDEKAHSYAKIYASLLSDEYQRKRAYASIAALYAFINLAEKLPVDVQKSMTLFRNPFINEQYEVSDLYINNWHLDIRVVTGGDAVLIPKIHYESDIVPDFYVVIKIDSSLQNAELIGFADTANVNKEAFDYHYYSIPFSSLINYEDFLIKIKEKKKVNFTDDEHELFRENYLGLMDNEIDVHIKNKLLKHLFECSECRTEFCCFTGFEMVSCNASKYPELLDDKTLDIVGAQNVEDKKYEGKEETIYIGNEDSDLSGESLDDESKEETVSDILDELFNMDEEILDTDTPEDKQVKVEPSEFNDLDIVDSSVHEFIENNDLEIIEDDTQESLSLEAINENDGLQLIDDNETVEDVSDSSLTEEQNPDSDFVLLDNNDDDELISEISDSSSEIETILSQDESVKNDDNVQKVIVDYDEFGEPIYSYITGITQEDAGSIDSEIETVDDSDEPFEEYKEDASNNESEIESIDDEIQVDDNKEFETYTESGDSAEGSEYVDSSNDDYENRQSEKNDDEVLESSNEEFEIYDDDDKNPKIQDEDNIDNFELESDDDTDENTETTEEESEDNTDNDLSVEDSDEEEGEYDDYDLDEVLPEEQVKKSSSKVLIVIISLFVILGLAGGAFFFMKNGKNNGETPIADASSDNAVQVPDMQQTNDMFESPNGDIVIPAADNNNQPQQTPQKSAEPTMPSQGSIPVPELTESDLIKPSQPQSNGDVNQAIANAFTNGRSSVSLKELNWFCTSELFSDKVFKNYLQNLDNTLKQNLKNNILNATEVPQKDIVAAKFAVDNNGNLQKVIISESSGSEEIDNIVLQSINESFEGEKSQILNDSTLKADMYYLKVVIKL